MDIIALLAANIEQMDKAIEDKSKDVMEHKLYLWENLSELDRAEKSAVRQIVTQQVAASESLAEKKKRYRKMMAIPYFGRIDFQEKGQPEVLPLYIGIHSFFNPPTNENLIHYNPQIQISAESETKRSIFREKDKTKRSKKESAQHSKSRNKSFVMTSVSAL